MVFPNPSAALRLADAVLVEQHDEWQVSGRRYLPEGSMAAATATAKNTELPPPPCSCTSWASNSAVTGTPPIREVT